jgi:hypothetical protein
MTHRAIALAAVALVAPAQNSSPADKSAWAAAATKPALAPPSPSLKLLMPERPTAAQRVMPGLF